MTAREKYNKDNNISIDDYYCFPNGCPSHYGYYVQSENECQWEYLSVSCSDCWNDDCRKEL